MWILVLISSALSVGPYVMGLARQCHFEMGKTPLPAAPRLPHRLKLAINSQRWTLCFYTSNIIMIQQHAREEMKSEDKQHLGHFFQR
jgi:hypothetical protein